MKTAAGQVASGLAQHPPGTMLDERALASALGVSPRTVRRMVDRCELPPGVRLGARKIWLSEKVLSFLRERSERGAVRSRRQAKKLDELF